MKNECKIFKILFKIGFLKLSKYVEASLVNLISALVFIFVQFFVWKEIMANNANTGGYTFYQMFSYIIFAQILFNFYPNMLGKQLSALIRNGDISFALTKPLPIMRQLVYENMGVSGYKLIFTSIPVFLIGAVISRFRLTIKHPLFFVVSICLSYMIFAFIDMLFGMLQFYTTSTWGIASLKYALITLLSGQVLPINLYPLWCRKLINYLPFRHLYDTPLQILIGQKWEGASTVIITELVWLLLLYLIFQIVYSKAVKNIVIQGG